METSLELPDNSEVNSMSMSDKKPAGENIDLSERQLQETTTLLSTMTTLQSTVGTMAATAQRTAATAGTMAATATMIGTMAATAIATTTRKQQLPNATKSKVIGKTNTKAKVRATKVAKSKVSKSSNEPIARVASSVRKHMKSVIKGGQTKSGETKGSLQATTRSLT